MTFEEWWEKDCRYLGAEETHKADFLFKDACQRAFTAGTKATSTPPTYAQGMLRAAEILDELADKSAGGRVYTLDDAAEIIREAAKEAQ